ncbi:hypothetical protein [Nocardia otitidiscaviarum]|uniref:hypothetical protein n=1 Tax=Nocardia otitidiscaviarum TaxID=1823 RepID=UPI001894781D|nr:hypothetical protein [Nocardia otitidiscaviarum]MBF6180814.1 hypothetical protein [Nocardia otitidiscaviarum]
MIPIGFTVDRGVRGLDTLAEVLAFLMKEALLVSAFEAVTPNAADRVTARRSRHSVVYSFAQGLEQATGLRFTAMRTPFLHHAVGGSSDVELSGYLSERPHYPPSDWLLDLFVRWEAHTEVRRNSGSSRQSDGDSYVLESARLQRAALHHAWKCGSLTTATDYVVDMVESGLCRDARGAARALTLLLWAIRDTDTPEDLVRRYFGGQVPATRNDWAHSPLTEPDRPARVSRSASAALTGLIQRPWLRLADARGASDIDGWFIALTRAVGVIQCTLYVLQWISDRIPLGARAVYGQLTELDADYAVLCAMLRLDGTVDMSRVVAHQRSQADVFRRKGDSTGDRYAHERMVVPRWLLEHNGELPPSWRYPGWRTATLLNPPQAVLAHLSPGRAVIVDPLDTDRWRVLARHFEQDGASWAAAMSEHTATAAENFR